VIPCNDVRSHLSQSCTMPAAMWTSYARWQFPCGAAVEHSWTVQQHMRFARASHDLWSPASSRSQVLHADVACHVICTRCPRLSLQNTEMWQDHSRKQRVRASECMSATAHSFRVPGSAAHNADNITCAVRCHLRYNLKVTSALGTQYLLRLSLTAYWRLLHSVDLLIVAVQIVILLYNVSCACIHATRWVNQRMQRCSPH
jgi:hypothetical protein